MVLEIFVIENVYIMEWEKRICIKKRDKMGQINYPEYMESVQYELNRGKYMKYQKRPLVIEAIQYTGDNKREIINFTDGQASTNTGYNHLTIPTLEGYYKADVGDWIIKGIKGEFYPCKPDIFEMTYEVVHVPDACNTSTPKSHETPL